MPIDVKRRIMIFLRKFPIILNILFGVVIRINKIVSRGKVLGRDTLDLGAVPFKDVDAAR